MAFTCKAHILSSTKIRVVFNQPVTASTALLASSYSLVSLAPPGTAITPSINSVSFYDTTSRSVVIEYNSPLTYNTSYSITISGVTNESGTVIITTTYNLLTTVQDPPRVLGAYLSIRGCVDILFDRAVGPNSGAATAHIWGPLLGRPGVAMTQVPWSPALPNTTLRFQLPVGMPTDSNFYIDLTGVVDNSFNTNSETIPLTLVLRAPAPYNYVTLTQVQIIDAYVADINTVLQVCTVRVYLSCALDYSQSINTANWTAKIGVSTLPFSSQYASGTPLSSISSFASTSTSSPVLLESGPYTYYVDLYVDPSPLYSQPIDVTVTVNSEDIGSITNPLNYTGSITARSINYSPQSLSAVTVTDSGFSAQFDHEIAIVNASSVQISTSTQNAVQQISEIVTASNQIKFEFNRHASNTISAWHTNPDTINAPIVVADATNLASAITLLNAIRTAYEAHRVLTAGPVHSLSDTFNALSAPVATDLASARFLAENILFEYNRHLQQTGVHAINDNVNVATFTFTTASIVSSGVPTVSATLSSMIWVINNLLFSYSYHNSVSGAGHQNPDITNVVISSDYITTWSLLHALSSANRLKTLLNAHFLSTTFHYNQDLDYITSSNATDMHSLVVLVDELRKALIHHNASGSGPNPLGPIPLYPGVHAYPGFSVYSARLYNLVQISYPEVMDSAAYNLSMTLNGVSISGSTNTSAFQFNQSLTGIATHPSLASVIQIPGWDPAVSATQFNPDSVQFFFSKSMRQVVLNASNISITGGSIVIGNMSWADDHTASISVSNTSSITYTAAASDLMDTSGNALLSTIAPVTFTGSKSVIDRTVFTKHGPIVKKPIAILTGVNLQVVSATDIHIPTGSFISDDIGKTIKITGSYLGRNDGTFVIQQVVSSTRITLAAASFDISDTNKTINKIISLANDLRTKINRHLIEPGIHGTNDIINTIVSPVAVDLASSITLLNEIRLKLGAHIVDVSGSPKVHTSADVDNIPSAAVSSNISNAMILANDLRLKYENHRQLHIHLITDFVNVISYPAVKAVTGVFPGPLTGPFSWTLYNPFFGMVANDPIDVTVHVNGSPGSVDGVIGLLGAIILTNKPVSPTSVLVDYDYINDPPTHLLRLNSSEFTLNQIGNHNYTGLPGRPDLSLPGSYVMPGNPSPIVPYPSYLSLYRLRSSLVDGVKTVDLYSSIQPEQVGWKYKAITRSCSAVLNDPTTLLLNVPSNRLMYPVFDEVLQETTIRYDPITLPQNASDPWTLEGDGGLSLASDGSTLTITDSSIQTGPDSKPPFFTHKIDVVSSSVISAAFRVWIESTKLTQAYVLDGVFTGVAFGVSDGLKAVVVGLIESNATSLTSAITRANDVKKAFNAHLIATGVHVPNDTLNVITIVNASDLPSLIILLNLLKNSFNAHIAIGGLAGVHQIVDVVNNIVSPDAHDLESSIILANELAISFNSHRTQSGVHFIDDVIDIVKNVKQVGILTSSGAPELETSWEAFSVDWTIVRTYRISRDASGNVGVYLSGSSTPDAYVEESSLPSISELDGRFDPLQQVFFGSIERESKSESNWNFIRVTVVPLDFNLIGDNKSVDYEATVIPEKDSYNPWISIGQGGYERITGSTKLLLDSTASASPSNISALGLSSGAYKGFLRYEPILTSDTSCAIEFRGAIDYYTFGVNNLSAGVFLDDNNFSTYLSYIQYSPSPATITGAVAAPFSLINGDTLILSIQNGSPITIPMSAGWTLSQVIVQINTVTAGEIIADDDNNHLRLTSVNSGADANFSIVGGTSPVKFGLTPGFYSGKDSNPEPRVSWFAENLPDQDDPEWVSNGSQTVEMLGRILRITDSSTSDYEAYTLSNLAVTKQVFNASVDWKLDIRLNVQSFESATVTPAVPPFLSLYFAGALVSIDEGATGKNIEMQLTIDISGNQYISILSYDYSTGQLELRSQYAFSWNDDEIHSFNIYTNKTANTILILADGVVLSPVVGIPVLTYSGLNSGAYGPAITFGSGSEANSTSDPSTAQSVVDWYSVAIFRDSKLTTPSAASNRYIGLYRGGDPSLLDSYYLYQIDWSMEHTYRVVRDPVNAINVYVDSGAIPVISASYDSLTLPPVSSSFFKDITNSRSAVAFGSFNSQEISRSRWDFVRYSMGKITLTNRIVPPHQVLNQVSLVTSPDHLQTSVPHIHRGFSVYSGGTPTDDFLSDQTISAAIVLGEGTPIIQTTQDLDTRGGLQKTVTPVVSIPAVNVINTAGYLSEYENDVDNVITTQPAVIYSVALTRLISLVNDLQSKYNAHLIAAIVHSVSDTFNTSTAPTATNLPTAITLVNDIATEYNLHITQAGVHIPNDTVNVVTLPPATDLQSAILLANQIRTIYESHRVTGRYHIINDTSNTLVEPWPAVDLWSVVVMLDELRVKFNRHVLSSIYHSQADLSASHYSQTIAGVGSIRVDANTTSPYVGNTRVSGDLIGIQPGDWIYISSASSLNYGVYRSIALSLGSVGFVAAPFPSVDTLGEHYSFEILRSTTGVTGTASVAADKVTLTGLSIPLSIGDVIEFSAGPNTSQKRTVLTIISPTSVIVSTPFPNADPLGSIFFTDVVGFTPQPIISLQSAIDLANTMRPLFNEHVQSSAHISNDTIDLLSFPLAWDLPSLLDSVNEMYVKFSNHMIGYTVHVNQDVVDSIAVMAVHDDVGQAILIANEFKARFNQHIVRTRTHVINDTENIVQTSDATDVAMLITLVNAEKVAYELHRVKPGIHVTSDMINSITAPDATDLNSAINLANDLRAKYEAHRIQSGVHGSSVFIRLDPPSGVMYEKIQLYKFQTGTQGYIYPFSDDEYCRVTDMYSLF